MLEARGKPRQPRPSHRLGKAEDGLHVVIRNSGLLPESVLSGRLSGQWLVSLGWKHMRILVTLNVNLKASLDKDVTTRWPQIPAFGFAKRASGATAGCSVSAPVSFGAPGPGTLQISPLQAAWGRGTMP